MCIPYKFSFSRYFPFPLCKLVIMSDCLFLSLYLFTCLPQTLSLPIHFTSFSSPPLLLLFAFISFPIFSIFVQLYLICWYCLPSHVYFNYVIHWPYHKMLHFILILLIFSFDFLFYLFSWSFYFTFFLLEGKHSRQVDGLNLQDCLLFAENMHSCTVNFFVAPMIQATLFSM